VDIVVLYPHGRTSKIQELQMSTVDAPNVHVVGVDGTSDDLDVPIRNVFNDAPFCAEHSIMSANSINVARILIQTGEDMRCGCVLGLLCIASRRCIHGGVQSSFSSATCR
jgi:hypothetical protein